MEHQPSRPFLPENCLSCRFLHYCSGRTYSECRRFPKMEKVIAEDYCCGEWQPKESLLRKTNLPNKRQTFIEALRQWWDDLREPL
jgi:hypothetical protein